MRTLWLVLFGLILPCLAQPAEPQNVVVAGINMDFPPYEFLDSRGEPQGFDVELLQRAAKVTGLEVRFHVGPWEQIKKDFQSNRIDMLAGMLRSPAREQYADFSSPCMVVHYSIFIRKDSYGIKALEDLRGRKILVEDGSQMHEHLKVLGFSREIVPVPSEPEALRMLAEGHSDAALVPILIGAMAMDQPRMRNLQQIGKAVYSRELCFAVAKGRQDLLERLNTGLSVLKQTGEYARIYDRWFGRLERSQEPWLSVLKRGLWVLLPLAGLAAAWLGWTWSLRTQVQARTRELNAANQSLREKERFLAAIVDHLPVAVFGKDPTRDFAYSVWNKRCVELFGWDAEKVLGRTDFQLAPFQDAQFFLQTDLQAIRERKPVVIPEDYFVDGDRPRVHMHTVKVPIFDEEDRPWMVLAISEDVTLKRKTEAELLKSRASLAEAQRVAHVGSWEWDPRDQVLRLSDEACRMLGVAPPHQDITLPQLLRRTHPSDRTSLARFIRRAGQSRGRTALVHRLVTSEAQVRYLQTTLETRSETDGTFAQPFGTTQDITEHRIAEETLRQAQKLEGLGVLAGGIAHDFNNLLSAMIANLNLAQMHIPEDSKAAKYLGNMEATVVKASELTRQMLAYSGRGTFVIQPLDLNRMAQEITQLLRASIPKKIEIRFDFHPELPHIEADIAQIQQVLMNLVTNASEAIGDADGVLTIRTGVEHVSDSQIQQTFPGQPLVPGPHAFLEVADTGCGMDEETRSRIFEPFFTTKFSGRGLGLAALRGILKGHRAGIRIESRVGTGSTFRILFPVASPAPESWPPSEDASGAGDAQPSGTILLVDDEPEVLNATTNMLLELGCQVVPARDGLEALARFREAPDAFAAVVLDLTMPRMDGHEALREMRKLKPDVRVLLCSGYHEREALRETRQGDPVGFLHKPFSMLDLRNALGRLTR